MVKYNGNNGHRQRLRNRFITGGTSAFAPHELLELFLQISIPRRDTKPLAKQLLTTFGSVGKTLNADKSSLTKLGGIGEKTAHLFELYSELESTQKEYTYPSYPNGFEQYAATVMKNDENMEFYFAVTDGHSRVIYCRKIFDGGSGLLADHCVEIAKTAMRHSGSEIYLFQHRPSYETLKIYDEDVRAITNAKALLAKTNVRLADFIIICGNRFCSYKAMINKNVL